MITGKLLNFFKFFCKMDVNNIFFVEYKLKEIIYVKCLELCLVS